MYPGESRVNQSDVKGISFDSVIMGPVKNSGDEGTLEKPRPQRQTIITKLLRFNMDFMP
jgi:hypothetical protein